MFSNAPRKYARRCLDSLGLREFFRDDFIFGVEDVMPACKPEAAAFRTVLDAVGADAASSVMFEDSLKNIRACRALGMRCVFVEEEVGGEALVDFLKQKKRDLKCDGVVVSDTGMPDLKHPALTYALRGVAALEVRLDGPDRDLHSGIYGGSVENPAMALSKLLAQMIDKNGRIAVPGFYDDVAKLSAYERKQMSRLLFSEARYKKLLGVKALFGEKGFTPNEHRAARPTFEINGLTSGYQGEGSKTIVPSHASAKITMRLVPHQDAAKILRLVARHLKSLCPPTMRMKVELGHVADPYIVSPTGRLAKAALKSLKSAFGHEPVLLRGGGSIPIVEHFARILKVDTYLLGLALPDDNLHSPNEKMDLEVFTRGIQMSANLWTDFAEAS